jgi:ATP-binding cassette subfamily B (MDR/TAP) protein 1
VFVCGCQATAALDNESERLVNDAIERLLETSGAGFSRTTIVIAHRLSSIKACDKIIVMERGQVVEEGTHDALAHKPAGTYAALLKLSEGKTSLATAEEEPQAHGEVAQAALVGRTASPQDKTGLGQVSSMAALDLDGAEAQAQDAKKPKAARKRISVRRALPFVRPDAALYVPALLGAVVNGMTFPIMALIMANLMTIFFGTNASWVLGQASIYALAFFGLGCAAFVANLMQHWAFGIINGRTTARVRSTVFRHMVAAEIGFFDRKENSVGALTSKLASDAAMVKAALSDRVEVGVTNTATVITGLAIAFSATWKLSLVVFAVFPMIAVAGMVQMLVMGGLATSDQADLAEAAQTLSEAIAGIRTVAAFSMQPMISRLYQDQLAGPLQRGTRKGFVGGLGFGLSNSAMFFAYALCYWYGSTLVASGEISFLNLNQALFGVRGGGGLGAD